MLLPDRAAEPPSKKLCNKLMVVEHVDRDRRHRIWRLNSGRRWRRKYRLTLKEVVNVAESFLYLFDDCALES